MAKILIIDDDPLLVRMYQTKFVNDGYEVEVGDDGDQVVEKILSFQPDLVLLDVMMPHVNGLDALKAVKENPKTKATPVVLLTNVSSAEGDAEKGLELGAVTYLVKAEYTPAEVVSKVKEILGAYTRELPKVKVLVKD